MATTFTKIASVSVGVLGAATIDFTSIPSTYTDLMVYVSARTLRVGSDVSTDLGLRFNSDSGSVYSSKMLEGSGSATRSTSDSGTYIERIVVPTDDATANTFSNNSIYIPDYTITTTAKSVSIDAVMENNATTSYSYLVSGLWNPATKAAITAISLTSLYSSTFVQYSTATLYGINKS
jgi:hypothetical protein